VFADPVWALSSSIEVPAGDRLTKRPSTLENWPEAPRLGGNVEKEHGIGGSDQVECDPKLKSHCVWGVRSVTDSGSN
jgi:hypothetical protein